MKKIILVILSTILFASNTIVLKKKEKETNNTAIKEEVLLRKWIIDRLNAIMPEYLQAEPSESMFFVSFGYDFHSKKLFSKLNTKLVFPALESEYSKSTFTKTNIKTKIIKFKLLPILHIYKQLPCLTLKGSITLQSNSLLKNIVLNETIYYYTTYTEYKEITTLTYKKFIEINNLSFKASKTYKSTDKANINYLFGLYYYTDFYKFIRIYGFETGGERKKDPFICYYKLFFTYRHILFNKRYIFLELTPYILVSKEFNFSPKIFASASFNVKF
jgi:hypothetical protein